VFGSVDLFALSVVPVVLGEQLSCIGDTHPVLVGTLAQCASHLSFEHRVVVPIVSNIGCVADTDGLNVITIKGLVGQGNQMFLFVLPHQCRIQIGITVTGSSGGGLGTLVDGLINEGVDIVDGSASK